MDEKTREKVHQIAKSLKDLHLAASMEEALVRAKEIVESSQADGKPIRELMADMKEESKGLASEAGRVQKESDRAREELFTEAHGHHKTAEEELSSALQDKSSAKSSDEKLGREKKVHTIDKVELKGLSQEVDQAACAAKDAEFIVKEAEQVQKKKK